MKKAILYIFCLVLTAILSAQNAYPLSIEEFINGAVNDEQLTGSPDKVKIRTGNTPLFNKLQLRYQFEDAFYKNEFSLRFYFNGLGETSSAGRITGLSREISSLQSEIILSNIFKERYILVAEMYCLNNLYKNYSEMKRLYSDKIDIIKKSLGIRKRNYDDLLKAEMELDDNQVESFEIESLIKETENKIHVIVQKEEKLAFDFNRIITADNMKKNLEENKAMFSIDSKSNIYLKNEIKNLELSKEELEFAESEDRRYIDFISVGVDTDDKLRAETDKKKDKAEAKATFGVGINLPFISSKSTSINKKKTDIENKSGAFIAFKKQLQAAIDNSLAEFNGLNRQLTFLLNSNSNRNAGKYSASFRQLDGTDPMVLLNIRENIIKREIKIETLKHKLFLMYFEILEQSGLMVQDKAKNYILN